MSSAMGKSSTAATTAAQLLSSAPTAAEKNKQWQRELLMERIRSRANQHKSFAELSKAMRMSMLEKRYALDAVEKANLQKCLDSMQHCIKVTSRQGLVERLESLSRQLGLKFMEDTSGLFISTDMFFLEIILDSNGALTDVKVHHECKIEQQSCSELVNCLKRGDFADFTVQLEGLSSIYQLNAEPKVKTKAFVAMQAMETDLYNIFQMQNFTKDSLQLVKTSSVGLVLKRRGGHPMKLIYFVSPYDLISIESKSLQPLSTELITSKDIGCSVTVNLEASSANKLQILPVVSTSKDPQTGAEVPIYAPLNQQNSMLLPATFVLRLNKPLPVCYASLKALGVPLAGTSGSASGLESSDKNEIITSPIMNLVVQTASEQQMKNSQKGLFVNLPDQTHCYFFTENRKLQATIISSVPYTEPMQVPKILEFLKRQALFYTLLASCVRAQSKMGNDMESTTILEVNAISFQHISVSLQHPYEESMATVEFDLRDGNVKCTIYSLTQNYDLLSMKLTAIVEKCLSIPVTIRALLKYWDQETMKIFQRTIGAGIGGGGGSSGLSGSSTSAAAYGNFGMGSGVNDSQCSSNSGRGGSGGAIKMEPNTRQQQMTSMASTSAGLSTATTSKVAGFLQFKSEVGQQEDFHDSPKSQMQNSLAMHATDGSSSLGGIHQQQQAQQQQQQQQPLNEQQTVAGKQSEIEIADKYKNIWMDKTTSLKNCVSITPISPDGGSRGASQQQQQQGVDAKRTVGIEIIPLTAQGGTGNVAGGNGGGASMMPSATSVAQPGVSSSSTITITPINAVSGGNSATKDKKAGGGTTVGATTNSTTSSSSSGSNNKRALEAPSPTDTQKEKKRKKKRDDSPMGPPEKVFSRQNSPANTSEAAATAVARKFSSPSSSPKGGGNSGGMLNSSSSAATLAATNAALLSTRPSPKHSPVYSSPKHSNTASNSPKSPFGTHSPKHGSSGKPSMSTLKSATATSLSPKGDKNSCASGSLGLVGNTVGLSAAAAAGVAAANAVKSAMGVGVGGVGVGVGVGGMGVGVVGMQQMKAMNHLVATQASMATTGGGGGGGNHYAGVSNMAGGAGVGQLIGGGNGASVNSGGMDMNVVGRDAAAQAAAMRKVVGGAVSSTASTMPVGQTTATTTAQARPEASTTQRQSPPQPQQPPLPVTGRNSEAKEGDRKAELTNTKQPQASSSSEYKVKPSQEGLKLTINKTGSGGGGGKSSGASGATDSSSSTCTMSLSTATTTTSKTYKAGSAVSSNSTVKKLHTGLKPGVNSGPASKKFASMKSKGTNSPSATHPTKHPFQKSNSANNLPTKSTSSAGGTTNSSGGLTRSNSTNSFGDLMGGGGGSTRKLAKKTNAGATGSAGHITQPATRFDHQADMLKILQYASPAMAANMEGFMKGLSNSKFHIPKLSQRAGNTTTTTTAATNSMGATTSVATSSAGATMATATATATKKTSTLANMTNGLQATTSSVQSTQVMSDFSNVSERRRSEAQQQQQQQQQTHTQNPLTKLSSSSEQQRITGDSIQRNVNYYVQQQHQQHQQQQQHEEGLQMQQTSLQYANHQPQKLQQLQQQQSTFSLGYSTAAAVPHRQTMDEVAAFRSTPVATTTTSAGYVGK